MQFTSHIAGRNAQVTVWPNRVEWVHGGITNRRDAHVLLFRSITGLQMRRGVMWTEVVVQAPGQVIAFRCDKGLAVQFHGLVSSNL